ncbi:ATP-binding protein [Robinsoniella peoriensis]|uniref:ATP-binding protein n=1 Tax=Robinsoniella peoriensis TaxID=180332 RepID=UPI00362B770C
MKKSFRPSARLISTIGEDIIKDMHAAVVELVKNAYDADADNVSIKFKALNDETINITILDDGHGMTELVVEEKWLVPSTSDKLNRRTSPKGRVMQGRKGIGRFATAVLGEQLELKTINNGVETKLSINWNEFSQNKFLDEVLVDIVTSATKEKNGTSFIIIGTKEKLLLWNDSEVKFLIKELRKLLTPIENLNADDKADKFNIFVEFEDFMTDIFHNETIKIEPLPLNDYYDYKVSGIIYPNGESSLIYHNKNSGVEETITDFHYYLTEKENFSGSIVIDFRIFDRDPEAIENLVNELANAGEDRLGKNEAKALLNDIAGVSIFRNRFRIRPYGDDGNDWLSLDKKRVQVPTLRIGANQISGIIEIQDEEISNLVEKSARDGLKEDSYYDGLVSVVCQLLNHIELKRYSFRQKTGKGRKNHLFGKQIGILTDFSSVKNKVISVMREANLSSEKVDEVNQFIDNDINEKLKVAQEIEKQIAMYQGQATLGKIMNVVMHEVRKPLSWIRNQTRNIEGAYNRYSKTGNVEDLDKVLKIINETPEQMSIISNLFNRLNTLATRKRTAMTQFSINEVIQIAIDMFGDEFERKNIKISFRSDCDYIFQGWKEDILAAIANILENAVYWVDYTKDEKNIVIECVDSDANFEISIWNNGPKIIKDLLEDDSLFNPGISGKITEVGAGTGLGLAIAGEAIERNSGVIIVRETVVGAKFVIQLSKQVKEQ